MEGADYAPRCPLAMLTAESGIDHYFKEIQRFPMLDPQEEYMLARRWREESKTVARAKNVFFEFVED